MINHQIHNYLHAAFMGTVQHFTECIHSAKFFSYVIVVGDVISTVGTRGGIKRRKPDPVYPKAFDIVQFFIDTVEISHAISVSVFKTAWPDLIKHAVFIPSCPFHMIASLNLLSLAEGFFDSGLFIIP